MKRQWTRRRRRRKGHGWSKQSANKKKLASAAKSLAALQAEPVSAPELAAEPSVKENSPVKKKLIQKKKKKAKQSVKEPTCASDTISSTSLPSDPATSLAIAPPSTSATASATTTHRTDPPATQCAAPARALSNSSQTEPDLCIAAYVTLAVNGESCDEQEQATVKQIAQLPTPSPEADQPSVLLAHEIELATSNVPVYLLNGESRDVTTPVPPVSSVSASACDDAASEQ